MDMMFDGMTAVLFDGRGTGKAEARFVKGKRLW